MKRNVPAATVVISLFAFGASHSAERDDLQTQTSRSPSAPHTFQPGMDDLMTMLVTPRHNKLYYAGTAKNWELADFELRELRSAFRRIMNTIPVYRDRDVEETVGAVLAPHLDDTASAIAAGDPAHFAKAYEELTAACNACHTYLEHPFLVIKVPSTRSASAYPNQNFETPAP